MHTKALPIFGGAFANENKEKYNGAKKSYEIVQRLK